MHCARLTFRHTYFFFERCACVGQFIGKITGGAAKFGQRLPERLGDLRQSFGSEDDQRHNHDDEEFGDANAKHSEVTVL